MTIIVVEIFDSAIVVVTVEIKDTFAIVRILQKHFSDHLVHTFTIGVEVFSSHINGISVTCINLFEFCFLSTSLKVLGYDTPLITNPNVTGTKSAKTFALYGFITGDTKLLMGEKLLNTNNCFFHFLM